MEEGMKHSVKSLVVAAAALLVCACAGGESNGSEDTGSEDAAVVQSDATIIDVRTPEEFAAGHLEGAVLIDIKDASFDSKIAALDSDAAYIVYCRSGNRSAQAVERMRGAGIDDITDLGSLENASAVVGRAIVTQ
jgi:rhodanese-related sulfurtransferase